MLVLSEGETDIADISSFDGLEWKYCVGKVGAMDSQKIIAAVDTAAKRNGLIKPDVYREAHALYHAIIEALEGVTRGQVQLGAVLRTVGLRFSIIRGHTYDNPEEGEWIAVALYGTSARR